MTRTRRTRLAVATAAAALVALGCGPLPDGPAGATTAPPTVGEPATAPSATPRTDPVTATTAPAAPSPSPVPEARPRRAELDIPSIGVADLPVLPYEGTSDDRAGTRIQDRGVAASPHGDRGGAGPGDVGNYLVTAHRLSAGGPLRLLPEVEEGDTVVVTADDAVYEYRIVDTRSTSFRSAASLAEQRAPVPGKPGERPTRAMITLSTCATPEDDAAGNHWRDALGNPEHRIDKIGVLVATRPSANGP
ncbi:MULTISPECIES: class E sortase [unclassified Streptomyces]|uniref:class E sortase n=1 Tax=unclassified Streptomyces TaxID=2593676 RepID=UPI0035DE4217